MEYSIQYFLRFPFIFLHWIRLRVIQYHEHDMHTWSIGTILTIPLHTLTHDAISWAEVGFVGFGSSTYYLRTYPKKNLLLPGIAHSSCSTSCITAAIFSRLLGYIPLILCCLITGDLYRSDSECARGEARMRADAISAMHSRPYTILVKYSHTHAHCVRCYHSWHLENRCRQLQCARYLSPPALSLTQIMRFSWRCRAPHTCTTLRFRAKSSTRSRIL